MSRTVKILDILGFGKEKCDGLVGNKITLKIEGEQREKLSFQFTYHDLPDLNTEAIEAEAGQEKSAVIPNLGGKGTLLYKVLEVNDDAEVVETTFDSETTGKWQLTEKYTEKGVDIVSFRRF